jgi:hypothetical protein
MSELHKTCTCDDLSVWRATRKPWRPSRWVCFLGFVITKWRAFVYLMQAPQRWRLRREMDRALIDRSEHYSYGPAEHSARERLNLPPRIVTR